MYTNSGIQLAMLSDDVNKTSRALSLETHTCKHELAMEFSMNSSIKVNLTLRPFTSYCSHGEKFGQKDFGMN